MKISATQTGFALYKEADIIGQCDVTPTPKRRGHHGPVRPAPVAAERLRLLPVKRDIAPVRRL